MSEVSYSNVPPMMAAIRGGDIETLRSLLHAGHSPNEPQCYQVTIGAWPREEETSPLELAVLENRMDMVRLLIESGADLTHNPEALLYWLPAQSRPVPVFFSDPCGSQNSRKTRGYLPAVSPSGEPA